MTNKLFSLAFAAASFLGVASSSASTNVVVVLKNGNQQTVKLEESGFIYFSDGNMLIHPSAPSSQREVFPLGQVQKMMFSENSSAARVLGTGEMVLYPSQAEKEVFLANAPAAAFRVEVFNMAGEKVLSKNISGGEGVDVSSFSAGIYVLKANGSTFKFQKQ